MTFWQWLQENWVKTLSSIGALNSALITATASGMFTGLLPENSVKWLALGGFFMNAWLIGVGFNNSAKVAVAKVIDNALQATPPKQSGFARIGLLTGIAVALLAGCAAFGVPKLESFGERLAGGYVTVTGARTLTTALLNGQVIGSKDAQNVQDQANSAREGLDVAGTLTGLDAENKLSSALAIANAALDYLCAKAPTDPNCLGR